jgi:hypothetical protein
LLLAYRANGACLKKWDIRKRDIGERDIGERYIRETDIGKSLATCHFESAAATPHPHPRCFLLPQRLAELAPPHEVFAASEAPNAPAY